MLAATGIEPVFHDMLSVAVVGRSLFYNHSSFDGNDSAINASDDGAIAPDKTGLLPGATASIANYSSYSRGINGVMIDIAGLPSYALSNSDFTFGVGDTNAPGSWAVAPAPTAITVRPGAGINGSSRVEITWPDNAIQQAWLQVTVNVTPATGLSAPDVFYFGNAIGETGDSTTNAVVNSVDQQAAHNHPLSPAPLSSPYDFNRDGAVDAADESIAGEHITTQGTELRLISPPAQAVTALTQREPIELFNWGDGGYPVLSGGVLVTTKAGSILSMTEGRNSTNDSTSYALVMRRSTNNGITWSPPAAIFSAPPSASVYSSPAPVVDQATGKIFVLFNRNISDVLLTTSSDDGLTWTTPVDITASVKVTAAGNPGPAGAWANTPWGWYAVGRGIQLEHGPHAGRMLLPADHRITADNSGVSWSHVVYSDDHGQTWHLGGGLAPNGDGSSSPNDNSNECTLVELSDGSVYMSSRVEDPAIIHPGGSISHDGGITWSTMALTNSIISNRVAGALVRVNANVLLYASPSSADGTRRDLTIWGSSDDAVTWVKLKDVNFGPSGYSNMTVVGPDTILLAYNHGDTGGSLFGGDNSNQIGISSYNKVGLLRINLRFLQSSEPYQFNWYFNEQPPGGTANTSGPSIQDYGRWDSRAWPLNSVFNPLLNYVAGPGSDSALALTTHTDNVVLTQGSNNALQFDLDDSFTVEVVMRTTAASGVIIGTRPTVKNWTLQLAAGKVQFSLFDLVNTPTIVTSGAINDGQWHRIEAVRDATTRVLKLYVDGVQAATPVSDTTTQPRTQSDLAEPVSLGSYNDQDPASQLAFDVDTVRITRAALAPAAFLPGNLVSPKPPAPRTYPSNAPTSLPGLQLWLPPDDPSRYFADFGLYTEPLPLTPFFGMASRTMLDASVNGFQVSSDSPFRSIHFAQDTEIGPSWTFTAAPNSSAGSELQVHLSSSSSSKNFDFVQNTGVFTITTFVKVGAETGGPMTLFDNSEGSTSNPGFSLFRRQDGSLAMEISGGSDGPVRFDSSAPNVTLATGQWYQVAVVGAGPGNPIKFYVTPVSAAGLELHSGAMLGGANGTYPTDGAHDLFIGGRSGTGNGSGAAPFNGQMVNQSIFNQALSQIQIQQLFLAGKGLLATGAAWQNQLLPVDVDQNGKVEAHDLLLIINRLLDFPGAPLPTPTAGNPPPFYDTSGNGTLEPRDALLVINWIQDHTPASPSGQAVVEAATPSDVAEPTVRVQTMALPLMAANSSEKTPAEPMNASTTENKSVQSNDTGAVTSTPALIQNCELTSIRSDKSAAARPEVEAIDNFYWHRGLKRPLRV